MRRRYREEAKQDMTQEEIMDEIAADFTRDMIDDAELFKRFAIDNRNAAQKLLDALRNFILKVKQAFAGNRSAQNKAAQEAYGKNMAELEEAARLWNEALNATERVARNAEHKENATPNPKEEQIVGDGGEVQYQARKYWTPSLSSSQWSLLNKKMDTEIMSKSNFLDSATKWLYANENGVEVFALYGIGDGTVPTVLYASGNTTASSDYAKFVNYMEEVYHGVDNSGETSYSWLEAVSDAKREYYALLDADGHRAKTLEFDSILSKQLERIRNGNSERGVQDSTGVTEDSAGRKLTTGQRAYFKDSKAVDDSGKLLVVYHATNNDFTVFDGKYHSNFNSNSIANWFTDSLKIGKTYAPYGKTMEMYVNVMHPLVIDAKGKRFNNVQYHGHKGTFDIVKMAKRIGYDGVIFKNIKDYSYLYEDIGTSTVVATFQSNQSKLTTNENPSENEDIRFQLKETDGYVNSYNKRDTVVSSLEKKLSKKYPDGGKVYFSDIYKSRGMGSAATFYITFDVDEGDGYEGAFTIRYSGHQSGHGDVEADYFIWNSDIHSAKELDDAIDNIVSGYISGDSEDVRYQLKSLDSEYMTLAKNPEKNRDSLQKMVDEAAEAAGYTVKAYHGTTSQEEKNVWNDKLKSYDTTYRMFTVFKKNYEEQVGHFFVNNVDNAGGYGSKLYSVYLKMLKPLIIDCGGSNYDNISFREQQKDTYGWAAYAKKNGYDGVIFKNVRDGVDYSAMQTPVDEYATFNSNQIKSSDPVTYDDSGNVIPLSKRFGYMQDIRFQLKSSAEMQRELRELTKERNALQKRNAILTERVEKWRNELRRTKVHTVRKDDVRALANELIAEYGGTIQNGSDALSPSQKLCKPPRWCRIEAPSWRFYYVKKESHPGRKRTQS